MKNRNGDNRTARPAWCRVSLPIGAKLLAICTPFLLVLPVIAHADWQNPTGKGICDMPEYAGTAAYQKSCGGGNRYEPAYEPVYTPPDPRILALQRANGRYVDLVGKWRQDFGFISAGNEQEWLGLDRSSEEAFLSAADRLDRVLVDQINKFG